MPTTHFASGSTITADVAIAGGGVAGSSLAATLAGAGLRVVVVEREARFRDRVRGEALHPWGAAEADRLGLVPRLRAAGARPLPVWQRYEAGAAVEPYRWDADVLGGHVEWGVPHPALQETLLAHAADRGATVLRPADAIGFKRGRGSGPAELSVRRDEGRTTVHARLVVGAGGTGALARRWVGAASVRDPVHHVIGGCLLDGVALDRDSAHQAFLPGGMVVLFPQGDETGEAVGGTHRDRARAYLVCDPARGAIFRGPHAAADFLATLAAALPADALAGARPAGPLAFFPGIDDWADRLVAAGLVLIGDAAGANDPSQGHGLSLAFRDARELRDGLLGTAEADWPRATAEFAARRTVYAAPLRAHARWSGPLSTEQGPAADARRARVARARERDPSAGGYAGIFAFGPDGLPTDEAARRRFLGEDLDEQITSAAESTAEGAPKIRRSGLPAHAGA